MLSFPDEFESFCRHWTFRTEATSAQRSEASRDDLAARALRFPPLKSDFSTRPTAVAMRSMWRARELGHAVAGAPPGQPRSMSSLEIGYGRPLSVDEVHCSFPGDAHWIAQLGQPWVDETILLLGKHPNVFCRCQRSCCGGPVKRTTRAYLHHTGFNRPAPLRQRFPYTNATDARTSTKHSINNWHRDRTYLPVVLARGASWDRRRELFRCLDWRIWPSNVMASLSHVFCTVAGRTTGRDAVPP